MAFRFRSLRSAIIAGAVISVRWSRNFAVCQKPDRQEGQLPHTKFQKDHRIWVVKTASRLFVIYARCVHLGCTPDWKSSENKFKCPCHGSGYDSEGVNFEGPAPRPMDRAHVELAPDGQIIVDTSRLYQWPKGQPSKFNDPGAFLTGV